MTRPRHLCVAMLVALLPPLEAQQRPLPSGVAPFVSVDTPLVALTHVQLVDGTGAPARADQAVILNRERIQAVGPSATVPIPDNALLLDLADHTLLPGLVGLHEHTYFGGVRRFTQMRVSAPLLYLAFGVTTAMTAGSRSPREELDLKRRVERGAIPGPRLHVSGPYLDAASGGPVNRVKVTTPQEVRRVIAHWAGQGATWFKFLGGVSREVLGAGIEEAHARGLRVTGHLCSVTFTEAAARSLRNYEMLVEAGFAPEEAVQVMTLNGARILGEDGRLGSIAPRKLADLVVVEGDPLRAPADIYNVVTVFKDGIGYNSMRLRNAAKGKVGIE